MPSSTKIPSQKLKAVLAGLGWSHAVLAEKTGYSRQTIRNMASGVSQSLQARQKISQVLGVNVWAESEQASLSDATKREVSK